MHFHSCEWWGFNLMPCARKASGFPLSYTQPHTMLSGRKRLCPVHPEGIGKFLALSTLISYAFIKQFIYKICTCGYLFYILNYYSIQLCFVLKLFQLCSLGLFLLAPCLLEMSPPLRRFLNGSLLFGTNNQMLQAHLIFHIPFLESTSMGPLSMGHWRIL